MSDYDVVVIGAGNGGLTAAVSLAQRDQKVLLLERHNVPGGCATSFIRGRFEFEASLHQLSGMGTEFSPGPLRNLLARLDVIKRIEVVTEDTLYRLVYPNSDIEAIIYTDREKTIKHLTEKFPHEKDGIKNFFDLIYTYSNQWVAVNVMKDPEASKEKYPELYKYTYKSTEKAVCESVNDPILRELIWAYWGYYGVPPSQMSFGDLAIMLWAYMEFKPAHLKGGAQALSNALLNSFTEKGGDVRLNCGVNKIIVKDNKIKGVVTEHGENIKTDCVVSNADTFTTYVDLIGTEHVDSSILDHLGQANVGPSAFSVYLGLDCEPEELGITSGLNLINTRKDLNEKDYALHTRRLDKPEFIGMSCYDVVNPDFSPKGCCSLSLITLSYLEPWLEVPSSQYHEMKYKLAKEYIRIAEMEFPGITEHIEEFECATPITHLRYLNHPGGAIYGLEQHAKDNKAFNSPRSNIDGLFFSGSWITEGGYQPTLDSGPLAARAAIKFKKQG